MRTLQQQQAALQLKAALIAVAVAHADAPGPVDAVTAHIIVDETGEFEGQYECQIARPDRSDMLTIAGGSL